MDRQTDRQQGQAQQFEPQGGGLVTSAVLANFQHNRNAEIDGLSAIGVFLKCLTEGVCCDCLAGQTQGIPLSASGTGL